MGRSAASEAMSACRDAFMIHLFSCSMRDISFPWSSKVHLRTRIQVRELENSSIYLWMRSTTLMSFQTFPVLNIRMIRVLFSVTMLCRSSYTNISRSQNDSLNSLSCFLECIVIGKIEIAYAECSRWYFFERSWTNIALKESKHVVCVNPFTPLYPTY
jgi:hypothetical protein